jgi:hypothetical protein
MNKKELYACAYKEVMVILCLLPDEAWNKIPQDKKDFYFESMNKDYKFEIDAEKGIDEEKLLAPSKAILANIYRDYLASPEEKKQIRRQEQNELNKIEEEKRKKYNPDDIFKKEEKPSNDNYVKQDNLPVEVKNQKFYEKVFDFLKELFKKFK